MVLLGLIFGLIAGIMAPTGDAPSPGPQPWEPIRVVSTSHEVHFPNEVVLTLEAEATAEIIEVRMFYRLGRQRVRIYGYPDFTPDTRVSADFRIPTGGANYIPSGVDIKYHYVIRDAEGNTFESEKFSLEYKDPADRWQSFRRGDLIVLWHDRPEESVAEVVELVDRRVESVKNLLGLGTIKPMKAVILNSSREAGRSFPYISDAARRGHLYGGFAFGQLDVFVLVGLNVDGMVHEMTHLLIDEALDSPLARVPAWLNEGLAMYFESGSRGRDAIVSQAARSGHLLPLRFMGSVPGRPQDVRLFYAQSWSVVTHMMDTRGQEPMADLLKALADGSDIKDAIPEAYGMSLEELDSEWNAGLSGEPPALPLPNPGVVGTSVIIAGAIVVAVVAILLRWLRQLFNPPDTGNSGP